MLEEAVEVIRELWSGEFTQYQGEYFTVEDGRIYTLPDPLPHIYVAAAGIESADLAGRIGDGFISTAPKRELVQEFDAGGAPNPPALRADHRLLCEGRSAGAEDGARSLAERRAPGRTERRATAPAALHAGGEDRDRRRSRQDHRLRA
jgi:alkanesulfonate monooxygenase SsuD/methylene tetrahydromethanopterin reductase-like flavin-dependent oxidoreductase (luciferase family)